MTRSHVVVGLLIQFSSIVVEFAKESRPRREPYEERHGYDVLPSLLTTF